ncbi:hypothetical protein GCK72_001190 [Caenorhabditis remanei]|uniref:Uncharacterized protein n=1 Tax=Caenorhabditis remanei TaxID=31234 RepID=A0A6A5HT21_CAERE|nr:hypothetical protein GCK72_001190 [Caenorhabditis remanei]KAF1769373.1 hypothetical protein GCK72_001190 [Caenorhabditis remanei]
MEDEQKQRIPELGKYTALQSAYLQRKAVLKCEKYMKSGASTVVDYNHLLQKIIGKADSSGQSPFRLSPNQTFVLRSSLHLSDGDLKTAKKIFRQYLGFDVLSSRNSVNDIKKELNICENYDIKIV